MSKHISYSLDVQSINAAIKELSDYKTWVERKLHELCHRLASIGWDEIANGRGYTAGGEIQVYVEEIDNGYQVVANGKAVFFLEYGTGTLAGTGEILGTPPVDTSPGSYSNTVGTGTYQKWVEGGMNGEYRYTHTPRAGFYYGMKAIKQSVLDVAKAVFNEP